MRKDECFRVEDLEAMDEAIGDSRTARRMERGTQDQKPPETIYLQAGCYGDYTIGGEATWCDHRINDDDVEYVRVSEPKDSP